MERETERTKVKWKLILSVCHTLHPPNPTLTSVFVPTFLILISECNFIPLAVDPFHSTVRLK